MGFSLNQLDYPAQQTRNDIDWEETLCPLCDGARYRLTMEAPDSRTGGSGLWFAVVQCANCGLSYTNPRPTAQSIMQFYPADYSPHSRTSSKKANAQGLRGIFSALSGSYRKYLPVRGAGRLLDFGCGSGTFLQRMHGSGWQVTGIDIAAVAVERIHNESGLHALVGSLPHPELTAGSFDVVTMWESLEHVHNPLEVLRAAHQVLAPGGQLIVAVPNIDSLVYRWFGRDWYGLDLPRHLTHFNPWTLHMMLNRAGFRAGRIRMIRHSSWLRRSAQQAQQRHWLAYHLPSRLAAWYTCVMRRADCILAVATKVSD